MIHSVYIHAEPEYTEFETNLIQVAKDTLSAALAPSGNVSIALSSEEHVHDLNREYRNQDRPTDVLAFQGEMQDPETGLSYIGDVIIAVPIAEAQAESAGHSLEAELSLLVVHGILHLLGYDHATNDDKSEMWEIQSKIIANLDLRINEPR